MRRRLLATLLIAFSLLLVACGGGGNEEGEAEVPEPQTAGDPARGEELYHMTTIGDTGAPGCTTCHSVQPTDDPLQPSPVGPSHYGVADRAANYDQSLSAEEYLRQSIVEPDAHIVEGFQPGVMYQNYAEDLTEQQIDDLVAYLLTLHGD
ncbi:MAG TPA: c-type cytochrome [Candidatus Binatia bacterium]|jgi:mono/diheme cytochrome c family protein|nr:c-type cytochrome [Candidatus Binatia bacterium]